MRYWNGIVDKDLKPFCHIYNLTWFNERQVELAVALDFLQGKSRNSFGLEVGNVLAHYDIGGHRVVDLNEPPSLLQRAMEWPYKNGDVFEIEGQYDWIIAISTLEHVYEGVDPTGPERAMMHLRQQLRPGGHMLVTVPSGLNATLDAALEYNRVRASSVSTFTRLADPRVDLMMGNTWEQSATPVLDMPYGGMSEWADAVWILEWRG